MVDTFELDKLFKIKGFSREAVAKHLGITKMSLYRKMYNQSEFYASELLTLSKLLDIPVDSPIFFSDNVTQSKQKC